MFRASIYAKRSKSPPPPLLLSFLSSSVRDREEMECSLSLELTKKMASTSSSFLPSFSPPLNPHLRSGIVSLYGFHRPNLPKPISPMKSLLSSRFSSIRSSSICCLKGQSEPMPVVSISSSEPEVCTGTWIWQGYRIRYQYAGKSGPALVLVHGFGANSDHWQKNISVLAKSHRVYAIDLIGFGYSDKPNPRKPGIKSIYTFETWASQLNEFCADVVKDIPFFICNSIGGVVGLQAAVMEPQLCKGIVLLNISLRMLHINKQPWYARPFIKSFQSLLRNTAVGKLFYNAVATPDSVRSILCQPGLDPGAADVFLDFICYSDGPLPEELLPIVKCPVLVAWGDKDPWEPVELGKNYADFDTVEDFVILPNVGHCPQDEAPNLVNPLIESFVKRHSS